MCVAVIDRPPFRQYAEEAGIAHEYPNWRDRSIVSYAFDDLIFPTEKADSMGGAEGAESEAGTEMESEDGSSEL